MRREELKKRVLDVINDSEIPLAIETLRKKVGGNFVTIERVVFEIIVESLQKKPKIIEELELPFFPLKTSKSLVLVPKKLWRAMWMAKNEDKNISK